MGVTGGGFASMRLVLGAFSTDGYAGVDHAIVDVDGALSQRVKALADVCKANSLVRVVSYGSPAAWLPLGAEEEYRFNYALMDVSDNGMWFEDQPKHGDAPVQTRWIALAELERLREQFAGKTVLYKEGEARVLSEAILSDEDVEKAIEEGEDGDEEVAEEQA